MNKPEGVTPLFPKYFTERHRQVLEILGEENCLKVDNLIDSHEDFSFKPIVTYIKRMRVKKLLSEGGLTIVEIGKEVSLHPESIRVIQRLVRLTNKKLAS